MSDPFTTTPVARATYRPLLAGYMAAIPAGTTEENARQELRRLRHEIIPNYAQYGYAWREEVLLALAARFPEGTAARMLRERTRRRLQRRADTIARKRG